MCDQCFVYQPEFDLSFWCVLCLVSCVLCVRAHIVPLILYHRYPAAARPFYTMPCPDDASSTNSYDLFIRGQEICSGAQRVHDPAMLTENLKSKGMPLEPLR